MQRAVRSAISKTLPFLDRVVWGSASLDESREWEFPLEGSRVAWVMPDFTGTPEQMKRLSRLASQLRPGKFVVLVLCRRWFALSWFRGTGPGPRLHSGSVRTLAHWLGVRSDHYRPVWPTATWFFGVLPIVRWLSPVRIAVLGPSDWVPPRPSVSVVVPVRNEEGNVRRLFRELPRLHRLGEVEVVFVEGGSTDRTWTALEQELRHYDGPLEVRLLRQPGRGKADAVRFGFDQCTKDFLMILDGDLSVTFDDLLELYRAYCDGRGELIVGTRFIFGQERDAMKPLNYLGNLFFARVLAWLLGVPLSDSLCGSKAITRRDYAKVKRWVASRNTRDPFGDFDLILAVRALGLRVCEVPVRYRARTYGETNILRIRHGFQLLGLTLRQAWLRS